MVLDKIKQNILKIGYNYPFFSYISLYVKFKEDNTCPTIGINRNGVCSYNKEFLESLSNKELRGVILHELLHIIYMHTFVDINTYDKTICNIAMDIKVNQAIVTLKDDNYELPKGGVIPYSNYIHLNNSITINDLNIKNWLQIYNEIINLTQKTKRELNKYNNLDDHNKFMDTEKNEKIQGDTKDISKVWKEKIIQATEYQKSKGDIPGFLEEIINTLTISKLDWREVLNNKIQGYNISDYSYNRKHKNSTATNIYLPITIKESVKVRIFIDCSGSVTNEMLNIFLTEIRGIFNEFKHCKIKISLFDTKIQSTYNLDDEISSFNIKGRGGTDFSCCFECEDIEVYDLLIIFSDGECAYPPNRDKFMGEVLWLFHKKGKHEFKDRDTFIEVD
jgi:predicted metal-dependent peptidase